jgi:hypothetical protein
MKIMKNFYKPTPVWLRQLGDTLLFLSTIITSYGVWEGDKWIAIISLVTGVLGKFLTNLKAEDKVEEVKCKPGCPCGGECGGMNEES